MKTEFKKDLRCNYMIISDLDNADAKDYCIRILEHQKIDGIIGFEQRRLDDQILFYFDITSRQSMEAILGRTSLSKDIIFKICSGIINILERAYEFLLPEEAFILTPEYIYIDVATYEPSLCFLPGFYSPVKEQVSSLLEYMMNKVDYNDREAVLLIYRLYAVSREEGYTFEHLMKELKESQHISKEKLNNTTAVEPVQEDIIRDNLDSSRPNKGIRNKIGLISDKVESCIYEEKNNIPVMMEKVDREVEVPCYPLATYLYTAASFVVGIIVIIMGISAKVIYNNYSNRIEYTKLAALLLIVFCVEGYLLNRLFHKKNRITRMITKNEYIDPRQLINHKNHAKQQKGNQQEDCCCNVVTRSKIEDKLTDQSMITPRLYEDSVLTKMKKGSDKILVENDNPTCLLNGPHQTGSGTAPIDREPECLLQSIDYEQYQSIPIDTFPFFIGKLKRNVDYCLENDVVSRYHAKILKEDNRYYVMDMNSTNGTFINGEALSTYGRKEIKHGDEIRFANIRFRVELSSVIKT